MVERAVRLVEEQEKTAESQWAAIESIAAKIGCAAETLRRWVRRKEPDAGKREGLTTSAREKSDEQLRTHIQGVWDSSLMVYGSRKVWLELESARAIP